VKGTDNNEDDTVHTLRYHYVELTFCAVMLSLFHSFGDHENENENDRDDGEDEENDDNDIDGTQGTTGTQ
jgi:hypothetical protein